MDPFIILVRIVVSLAIVRFPLVCGLLSVWLDGIDWQVNFLHTQNLHATYDLIDKSLDLLTYMVEAFVIARSWKAGTVKTAGLSLFWYRALGNVLFIVSGNPIILVLFPNVFEGFFLFILCCGFILKREPAIPNLMVYASIVLLAIPKIVQEYTMHIVTPSDWRFIRIVLPGGNSFLYDNLNHQIDIAVAVTAAVCIYLWAVGYSRTRLFAAGKR